MVFARQLSKDALMEKRFQLALATRARVLRLMPLVLLATACGSRGSEQMDFARAALARNPNVEIVAVDERAGIFTVKDLVTGAVRTVRADELQAAPIGNQAAPAAAASAAASANDSATPIMPGEAATVATEELAPVSATSPASGAPATAAATDTTTALDAAQITNESTATLPPAGSGKLVAAGPGYSITRSGGSGATARNDNAPRAAAEPTRLDPIICQGQRFMRIDGQTLDFASDAIIAEDGCDLHITNARIRAEGVALTVRNARVHVTNSTITGRSASLEASGSAEVFSSSSTFDGITRRFDESKLNDLGGSTFLQ